MAGGDMGRSPWVEPGAQPSGNGSGSGTSGGSSGSPGSAAATEAPAASPWAPAAPPWAAVPPGPPPRGQGPLIAGIVVLSVVVVAAMVGVIVVASDGDGDDDDRAERSGAADDGRWVRDGELHFVQLAVDGQTVCTTGDLELFCLDGTTGEELWSEQLPGQATSPTLVGGTLVVGAEGGPRHGDMYGYSLEGRRLWESTRLRDVATGSDPGMRQPALPAAGHVVAVLAGEVARSELVGVDARTGREVWRALGPEPGSSSGGPIRPPVSDGHRFYAVAMAPRSPVTADELRALDPADPDDAAVLRILDQYANADPADPLDPSDPEDLQLMVDAGILELVNGELAAEPVTSLVALDGATGEELWRTELEAAAFGVDAAVPLADGSAVALVIGAESDQVVVVDVETGEQRWEAALTSDRASVARAGGATVVAEGTTVAGFDDDGSELWRVATPGAGHDPDVPPGLAVEDGTLYAFGVDVFEIDPRDGGAQLVQGSVAATDVAVADDHLVVAGVGLQGIPLRD